MYYNIKRNNQTIASVVAEGTYTAQIMGEEVVNMSFTLSESVEFLIGDYVEIYGQSFILNLAPEEEKISSIQFKYTLQFESVKYELGKIQLLFPDSSDTLSISDFSVMGDARRVLELIIQNANRVQNNWKLGIVDDTETKNFSFSAHNLLTALTMLADEFENEFWIDKNKTIHFTTKKEFSGLTLQYGIRKGLRSLYRSRVDSSNIVTRLFAYGSEKNISSEYRNYSKRLKMDVPYLEANVDKFGIIEHTEMFDDVYPNRKGKVTAINPENILQFTDDGLEFDLNSSDVLIPNTTIKVTFNTGQLAGYTLEVKEHGFNFNTKTFELQPAEQEKAITVPSELMRPAVGDEYVLTDIIMPLQYVTEAEAELKRRSEEYLTANCLPRLQYNVVSDPFYFEAQNIDIVLGKTIKMIDADFNLDADIRVIGLTKNLQDQYDVSFDLADEVQVSRIVREYLDDQRWANQVITHQQKVDRNIRRNYQFTREIQDNIFDTDGYFDSDKIKPLSIETKMLSVAARSQQFQVQDVQMNIVDNSTIRNTSGQMVHFTIADSERVWNILAAQINNISAVFNYIYLRCQRDGNQASFLITTEQIKFDADPNFYHFEYGYLSSIMEGFRKIKTSYGFSTINGGEITSGKILGQNGDLFIDIDNRKVVGKIEFTSDSPAFSQIQINIDQSKTDSINASKAYSDAQDELKRIQTEAYADGKVTAAEQRAIDDATAKAEAAKIYAAAQDNLLRVQLEAYADGQITAEEQQRIQQMQDNLAAAKSYAEAQANLAKIAANAYADGVIDEEEARAIADATAKMEIAKQHAQGLVNNIQIGGRNLLKNSNVPMHKDAGELKYNLGGYSLYGKILSGKQYTLVVNLVNWDGGYIGVLLNNGDVLSWDWKTSTDGTYILKFTATNDATGIIFYHHLEGVWTGTEIGNSHVRWATLFEGDVKPSLDWTPAPEDVEASIEQAKQNSINASKAYSDAQDELKRIQAEAYADGKVTAAEQRAIDDATAKMEASKLYAAAQDNLLRVQLEAYADGQITAEEQERIQQMQDNLAAAKSYAEAQANLAKIAANAYADGVIDEEEARAIADATAKMEIAKQHAQGLVNNIQIGGRNLLKNSNVPMHKDAGELKYNLGGYSLYGKILSGKQYTLVVNLVNWDGGYIGVLLNNGDVLSWDWKTSTDGTYILKFTATNDATGIIFYHHLEGVWTGTEIGNSHVRWATLFEGDVKPSLDWTPAPEDVESSILQAKQLAEQANQKVTDISNDNILSASEKQQISNEWNRIKSEYTSNYSLAINNGISTINFTNSYNDLFNYITPLLVDISSDSPIVGDVFRAKFKAYYDQNITLVVTINDKLRLGVNANTSAINQVNTTIERINKITSFLGTTVDNNVIATGVALVGQGTTGTGGLSGIRDNGDDSIFLFAGANFANRYQARWTMSHGGFERGYHSNGIIAFERGYDGTKWIFNMYNETGAPLFQLDSVRGLVPVNYTSESWSRSTLLKTNITTRDYNTVKNDLKTFIENNVNVDSTRHMPDEYFPYIYWVYKYSYTNVYICWEYYNGTHPNNAQYANYVGYKTTNSTRVDNITDGWYFRAIEGVFSMRDGTTGNQKFEQYSTVYYVQAGKIVETQNLNYIK
ncbi:phage tail protein [Empedobacter sp. R132-2]|uniref:phage tail protein n=1 Tax=Empedobacter sp. R132-2 TaxID=2746740 RepID=UPI0025779B9A|nr:phage tail protein [Empedobacter sp. R132-2]MDM1138903.1 phage tail protein [Empedobacter sp. R132-2]